MLKLDILALCFVVILSVPCYSKDSEKKDLARGWGDQIKWTTLEEGLKTAKSKNKPLMLLIHKTWCGACKNLKKTFGTNEDLVKLSEKFVMVNTEDDEEPKGKEYTPDGGYIPRILFLEPSGKVRDDIINDSGNAQYKYFYSRDSNVIRGMENALKILGDSEKETKETKEKKAEGKTTEDTEKKDLARGWGDQIKWTTLEEGLKTAKSKNKPLMLLIHKTWCGACKNLKKTFGTNDDLVKLSEKFVMVNTEDDEEPKGKEYTPDGGYIPRILFLEPSGKVRDDIINDSGNAQYKYFYSRDSNVIRGMENALKIFGDSEKETKEKKAEGKTTKDGEKQKEKSKEEKAEGKTTEDTEKQTEKSKEEL